MDSRTIDDIRAVVGPGGYAEGEPPVVSPATGEEAALVLGIASKAQLPVVPRGSGTAPSGAAIAEEGEIVLSSARLNRVVSVSAEDLIAVVEPGVRVADLRRCLEERGLFFPPDEEVGRPATIGGMIGEAVSGTRTLRYGPARNYTMGMRVALSTGEVIRSGATTLKCVTGYDLSRLLTGSLGTLGFVTEVFLKVLPRPETRIHVLAAFDRAADAARAASRITAEGTQPSALELIGSAAGGPVLDTPPSGASLLIETDGVRASAESTADRAESACRQSEARAVRRAASEADSEAWWRARREIFPRLAGDGPIVLETALVPRSKVADLLAALEDAGGGMGPTSFGHAGEARLHAAFALASGSAGEMEAVRLGVSRWAAEVRRAGGRTGREVTAGIRDRSFLPRGEKDARAVLSVRLKQALDPAGVMNPRASFEERHP